MRIGVDGRVLTDGYPGIGRALFAVLPALAERADEIVVFLGPEPRSQRFPVGALEGLDIEIHHLPVGLKSLGEQFRLPYHLRPLRLDVVVSPYFASALRWPCPRATMVHDLIPLTVRDSLPSGWQRLVYRWWLGMALSGSKIVLAPSRATVDRIRQFAPRMAARIRMVPHAVDERFKPASQKHVERVRARYGLGSRFMLVVAGDRPHKNLAGLTAAWAGIDADDREDAILVIVGEPPPRIEHSAVQVLGAVPEGDLPALYSGAVAAVIPSLEEGFGLPVAEAMACGTAVACSDRPALVEFAKDAALVFEPTCQDSVCAALTRLLNDGDLRAALVERGFLRAAGLAPDLIAPRLLEAVRSAGRSAS